MNETREHILKVSIGLFLQKSYKEVTMKEIVEKSDLSKGAFYHYFTSKEMLFKEIVNLFFTLGKIDFSEFPKHSLHNFYQTYIQHMNFSFQQIENLTGSSNKEKTTFNVFLILFDALQRFPEFLELEKEQYEEEVKIWESVIENSRHSEEIHSSASNRQIADLFLYCTDGVFIRISNGEDLECYNARIQGAFDTIYNGLKV